MEPTIPSVVLMGLGIVFAGIVTIMIICYLLAIVGKIAAKAEKKKEAPKIPEPQKAEITPALAAVIGAAIAEDCGLDISAVKIVDIKKVN